MRIPCSQAAVEHSDPERKDRTKTRAQSVLEPKWLQNEDDDCDGDGDGDGYGDENGDGDGD